MVRKPSYRVLLAVFTVSTVVFVALLLMPRAIDMVTPDADRWVDLLRIFVLNVRAQHQSSDQFEPYLGQLELVRHLVRSGDQPATYLAMNRFMDMLEAREGGISDEAAEAIWDYCYQVTPAMYHDVSRHQRADRKLLEKIASYGPPPVE